MHHSRSFVAALLTGALAACTAHADGVPSPANSTVPACVMLVGHEGTEASFLGRFEVIVRDLANNPIGGEPVTFQMPGAPDLFIGGEQFDPAVVVDCAQKRVTKITDAAGRVQFSVVGWSNGVGGPVSLSHVGRISSANLGLLGIPSVAAFDLDGSGGVGANDLSVWLEDFVLGQPVGRSDYDCSGTVGANDLSVWLGAFGSASMSQSGTCP